MRTLITRTRRNRTRVLVVAFDTGVGALVWLGWRDGEPSRVQPAAYAVEGLAGLLEGLDRPILRAVS